MPLCHLWSQLTQQLGYQLHIWLQHTHARTSIHTNTHTPQSMITHQGFRDESWVLTYRSYICRSLGLVVKRPQCASLFAGPRLLHATLRPHEYKGVQIQTLLLPAVASLDKEYSAYTFSPSHQGETESSYRFQTLSV